MAEGNGNGQLETYQLMVAVSPNQPPKLMNLKDIPDENLRKIYVDSTNRLIMLKAEVTSLITDMEAMRMEAERRGWFANVEQDSDAEDGAAPPADLDGQEAGDEAG